MSPTSFLACARTDGKDHLVQADEPLAAFHQRCGGQLPGPIVTPALLEIVHMAREYGLRLSRRLHAQDDREAVTMWVDIRPEGDGCELAITSWQTQELANDDAIAQDTHRFALARHMAEFSARLDARQHIMAIESHSAELAPLAASITKAQGNAPAIGKASATSKPWTDFVQLEGNAHQQPIHWRLLDGAKLRVEGSTRSWTANLVPLGMPEPGKDGFELHLVGDTPPQENAALPQQVERSIGLDRTIAPVLRQPVSRIIANAETIRTQLAGPLAEEYSNYAADIASAGEHLLALIDDLTTLDMVEDVDFAPEPDQIDLADVARRAVGILGVRAQEKSILVDAPGPGESVLAIGEFRRVLQILLNLLGNAIRYSPEGSQIKVSVSTKKGRARAAVTDQGEGLSEDEIARVFTKFERLGRSGDGGSGLGLYISRRLAQAMDGSLKAKSVKGQGARFTLELPADTEAG